eukprot:PLAT6635.1.p1 GENE.PLAT6635.1~~PLAT6635.1.p1  ORF type:complete len:998 (-),score=366.32 PLAT6635.1:507-3086(-)
MLAASPEDVRDLLSKFVGSYAFSQFIEARSSSSLALDYHFMLFDDFIDLLAKADAAAAEQEGDSDSEPVFYGDEYRPVEGEKRIPYGILHLVVSDDARGTHCTEPEELGEDELRTVYKYTRWPRFKPELLLPVDSATLTSAASEDGAASASSLVNCTPSELRAHRELLSYLSVREPGPWAAAMLRHAYGAWFLCIPFQIQLAIEPGRVLYRAFGTMMEATAQDRGLLDEPTFRALLVACGHGGPGFRRDARRLLEEMTRAGIRPNALTWGQFTRAVAEPVALASDLAPGYLAVPPCAVVAEARGLEWCNMSTWFFQSEEVKLDYTTAMSSELRIIIMWSASRCPACSTTMTDPEVMGGWCNMRPGVAGSRCRLCTHAFAAKLSWATVAGAPLPGGSVDYLSPLAMRNEAERALQKHGSKLLVRSDCRRLEPTLYWNLLWYCARLQLPPPFVIASEDEAGYETVVPTLFPPQGDALNELLMRSAAKADTASASALDTKRLRHARRRSFARSISELEGMGLPDGGQAEAAAAGGGSAAGRRPSIAIDGSTAASASDAAVSDTEDSGDDCSESGLLKPPSSPQRVAVTELDFPELPPTPPDGGGLLATVGSIELSFDEGTAAAEEVAEAALDADRQVAEEEKDDEEGAEVAEVATLSLTISPVVAGEESDAAGDDGPSWGPSKVDGEPTRLPRSALRLRDLPTARTFPELRLMQDAAARSQTVPWGDKPHIAVRSMTFASRQSFKTRLQLLNNALRFAHIDRAIELFLLCRYCAPADNDLFRCSVYRCLSILARHHSNFSFTEREADAVEERTGERPVSFPHAFDRGVRDLPFEVREDLDLMDLAPPRQGRALAELLGALLW